jgi:hypothetical protein
VWSSILDKKLWVSLAFYVVFMVACDKHVTFDFPSTKVESTIILAFLVSPSVDKARPLEKPLQV